MWLWTLIYWPGMVHDTSSSPLLYLCHIWILLLWLPGVKKFWIYPPIVFSRPPHSNWRPPVIIWRPTVNNSRPPVIMGWVGVGAGVGVVGGVGVWGGGGIQSITGGHHKITGGYQLLCGWLLLINLGHQLLCGGHQLITAGHHIMTEWLWRYRSRSQVTMCNTPSRASDHLCLI